MLTINVGMVRLEELREGSPEKAGFVRLKEHNLSNALLDQTKVHLA